MPSAGRAGPPLHVYRRRKSIAASRADGCQFSATADGDRRKPPAATAIAPPARPPMLAFAVPAPLPRPARARRPPRRPRPRAAFPPPAPRPRLSASPSARADPRPPSAPPDARDASDAFHEECGVVGVWRHPSAAAVAYYALHALQHRGQEGAGIVTATPTSLHEHKGLGLVSDVFAGVLEADGLPGDAAVAHNRYSTAGEKSVRNVQPFRASFRDGQVAIAHNGNLTNAPALRAELEMRGSIFATSSDTEVVLHLMATSVSSSAGAARKAADALSRVEGAFSIIILTTDHLIAVRDPHGFRPLVMGELPVSGRPAPAYVFASESCALDIVDARLTREVEPGEMVVVDREGRVTNAFPFPPVRRRACVFEHIYFSKPSSVVFGRSVYMSRFRFGELLATCSDIPAADAVVPVPESGVPAALGFAAASGIPFQQAIIRSHYVGRTFIQPTQVARDIGVRLKLAPVEALIRGKSVVVVDDSIVRGTTSKKIVRMLREAGASQVHMRIACPPITGGCFYGVDTPDREKLLSHRMTDEEACKFIGADSLAFLKLEAMHEFLADEAPTFCDACFSGDYPVLPAAMVPPQAAVGF